MEHQHEKVISYTKQLDGSTKIEQKSYYEKLSQEVIEIEKYVPTSFMSLKKDIESCLEHLTKDKSTQLVITINVKDGKPKLKKKWMTLQKNYPRR